MPGFDGLRALAVGAVVLFHLDRLPGGNLGVDAFFVLSGWLITWKLLTAPGGSRAIRRFWSGRLRRLMPASIVVLVSIGVLWPVAGLEVPSLRRDLLAAAVGLSNWATISEGGDYWARFGEPSPTTHFWSLAIEQQYYLVWPLVVLGVVALVGERRRVAGLVVGGCVIAAAASIVLMNVMFDADDPTAAYMNTFARAHTILIGAAGGAIAARGPLGRSGRWVRRLAPVAAVGAVSLVLVSSASSGWLFRWGFPVFAVLTGVVVAAVADGAATGWLAARPMRWLGERSYGLYLWHWPVFLLLSPSRLGLDGGGVGVLGLDVVRVAVALLLAALSYRLIETPVRRRQVFVAWRAPVAVATAMATLVVVAVGAAPAGARTAEQSVVQLAPPPAPQPAAPQPAAPQPAAPERTASPPALRSPSPEAVASAGFDGSSIAGGTGTVDATSFEDAVASIAVAFVDVAEAPSGPVRALVVGDSTGVQLATALLDQAAAAPERLVVGSAAFAGCGLSAALDGRLHEFTTSEGRRELNDISACVERYATVAERIVAEEIHVVVVSIGPWDALDMHLADGRVVSVADPVGRDMLADAYAEFVAAVTDAGATVVWIVPADAQIGWGRSDEPVNDPVRWLAMRELIDELGVDRVDLPAWLAAADLDGPEGRPDGVHLAPGLPERFVVEAVLPVLESLERP